MKDRSVEGSLVSSRSEAVMRMLGRHVVSVAEIAEREGISYQRVHKLIKQGRVEGAFKTSGGWWVIPSEWEYKRLKKRRMVKRKPPQRKTCAYCGSELKEMGVDNTTVTN